MASTSKCEQFFALLEIPMWIYFLLWIVDPFAKIEVSENGRTAVVNSPREVIMTEIAESEVGKKMAEVPVGFWLLLGVVAYDVMFIVFARKMRKVSLDFWRWRKESIGPFILAFTAIVSGILAVWISVFSWKELITYLIMSFKGSANCIPASGMILLIHFHFFVGYVTLGYLLLWTLPQIAMICSKKAQNEGTDKKPSSQIKPGLKKHEKTDVENPPTYSEISILSEK